MSTTTGNGERVFEHFLELPSESRMVIVDQMRSEERCRFTRCSRLSSKEVRKSKNYVHLLELIVNSRNDLRMCVDFRKEDSKGTPTGFSLNIEQESERKYVVYRENSEDREMWRMELDKSTDTAQFIAEHFKTKLQFYQNTIRILEVSGGLLDSVLKNYDFGVRSLNHLEELETTNADIIGQFMEKIRHPLKKLKCWELDNNNISAYFEQVRQVRDLLFMPCTKFNNEHFVQLSATKIYLHIGILTENDIFDFITAWRNGTIRENFRKCVWDLSVSQFSPHLLCQLLRVEYAGSADEPIEIRHNMEPGKRAHLSHYAEDYRLTFRVLVD